MANFMDMVKNAQTQAQREGDYLLPYQRGTLLIKSVEAKTGQGGKFVVTLGKIVSVVATKEGKPTQPVGSMAKIWRGLYGNAKKVSANFANLKSDIMAITGCSEDDLGEALSVVFGDDSEGLTDNASEEAQKRPGFRACGVLVDFETSEVVDKVDPTKKYDRVRLINHKSNNEPEDILKRQSEF